MYRFLKEEWPRPFWHLLESSSKRLLLRIDILYGNPALCALSRESFPEGILLRRRRNQTIHSPWPDYKGSDKNPVFLNYFLWRWPSLSPGAWSDKSCCQMLRRVLLSFFIFFILHLLRAYRQVLLYSIDFIIRLAYCAVCGFFSFIIFNWKSVPSGGFLVGALWIATIFDGIIVAHCKLLRV